MKKSISNVYDPAVLFVFPEGSSGTKVRIRSRLRASKYENLCHKKRKSMEIFRLSSTPHLSPLTMRPFLFVKMPALHQAVGGSELSRVEGVCVLCRPRHGEGGIAGWQPSHGGSLAKFTEHSNSGH